MHTRNSYVDIVAVVQAKLVEVCTPWWQLSHISRVCKHNPKVNGNNASG